jgi:hypothetical protein
MRETLATRPHDIDPSLRMRALAATIQRHALRKTGNSIEVGGGVELLNCRRASCETSVSAAARHGSVAVPLRPEASRRNIHEPRAQRDATSLSAVPSRMPRANPSPGRLLLQNWDRLSGLPFGKRLFSWAVGRTAPYTGSVGGVFTDVRPGFARVQLRDRDREHRRYRYRQSAR